MRGATDCRDSHHDSSEFQSTLLMRGATPLPAFQVLSRPYFNPRSSCEERPVSVASLSRSRLISIHAPHARSDTSIKDGIVSGLQFQSTLLMRGATKRRPGSRFTSEISIHAPHARSDLHTGRDDGQAGISIHAPHARSDATIEHTINFCSIFQSTLLMRGATMTAFTA